MTKYRICIPQKFISIREVEAETSEDAIALAMNDPNSEIELLYQEDTSEDPEVYQEIYGELIHIQ